MLFEVEVLGMLNAFCLNGQTEASEFVEYDGVAWLQLFAHDFDQFDDDSFYVAACEGASPFDDFSQLAGVNLLHTGGSSEPFSEWFSAFYVVLEQSDVYGHSSFFLVVIVIRFFYTTLLSNDYCPIEKLFNLNYIVI